ncbi:MAG: DUF1800 domain-containing protein [Deltaproteobacteria bacterium]|nr:DUF1800 domain-containing protein [Deltaproteobacteria bacterium]
MGDQYSVLSTADARQLLRRAGFSGTPTKIKYLVGKTRGAAADSLLRFRSIKIKPYGRDIEGVRRAWLRTMLTAPFPLQEKLILFWHDHFATGADKVSDPKIMSDQIGLLRLYAKGNFKAMVKAINKNPAMMWFLDTILNRKSQPNENYARELQELFTLGVKDLLGVDNYTQADVVQIARAFTGWRFDYTTLVPSMSTSRHDFQYPPSYSGPDRGDKVIYKNRAPFGSNGAAYAANAGEEGEAEIDKIIDIIFQHQDSQGHNTVARHIAHKLFTYFCHATPPLTTIDELITASSFDTQFEIAPLVRAMLCHDEFYATAAPAPFDATTKKSVKWPIDYVVSTMRLFSMRPDSRYWTVGYAESEVTDHLSNMGQNLLEPPSVFGWDWEAGWLNSATMLARYNFARDVIAARRFSIFGFHPENIRVSSTLKLIDLTAPADIVNAATDYLGITDQLTLADRTALIAYLQDDGNGGTYTTLDLHDYDIRHTKLHGLFGVLLQSAAYQLH